MAKRCGIDPETLRTVARKCAPGGEGDHLLGHGDFAACPRHRQCALPDRPGAAHRPDRPAGHRPASVARPEQCPGRLRCRPDPDGLSRLPPVDNDPRPGRFFEDFWQTELDPNRGLTVVEITDATIAGDIKGMYIMGENPAMSDPERNHAREALCQARPSGGAGHLPHRDRGLRRCRLAGQRVSRKRTAPSPTPTGGANAAARRSTRPAMRARIGGSSRKSQAVWGSTGPTRGPADVFAEMRACHALDQANITWDRVERENAVTYPCDARTCRATRLFSPTASRPSDGRGRWCPPTWCRSPTRNRPATIPSC